MAMLRRSIKDLRGFLDLLEESDQLATVDVEVDPLLEIAAITDRVCKQTGGGKALRFNKVRGAKFPVLTNLFGSRQRTAWALWTDHVQYQADRLAADLKAIDGGSGEEKLWQLVENPLWLPRLISNPPCQEVVEKERPDISIIPALKSWPHDGGRFLTMPMVFTRDPATGRDNCGMYRAQLFAPQLLGLHWGEMSDGARHAAAWQSRGKPMPVAIVLGGDPVLTYTATAPLPPGIEETAFAGYLRQKSIETARCLTSDLEVPARAEFVIEGYVLPNQTLPEGPFGNHTGYYAPLEPAPVMQVTAITHRKDALYPCTVVGRPPMENCYLAKATERLFLPLIQADHPEVVDLNMPVEGIFHGCALVSICKEEAGQGRRIIHELWERGMLRGSRLLVILDQDVRIQDLAESFWRTINHLDPNRDVVIGGSRIGIDATRKGPDEGKKRAWPPAVKLDDKTRRQVERRWEEYGIDKL
ncbi:MAG TPA: UbiD family decarboxylase [Geothermobacteraceae bacterium]|nr:UbiD family decarboxylase [Geothermobacteraceae bacterium]